VDAATANLFENTLRRLSDDGIRVVLLLVNALAEDNLLPDSLKTALNLAGDPSFNAAKPTGMLLPIHDAEQVMPMIERVWAEIGRPHSAHE
jgi:hypothetical protein